MTTKELLALVERWRDTEAADREILHHGGLDAEEHNWHMASAATFKLCADELAPIATALCAEVEALRKDAERLARVLAFLQSDSAAITFQTLRQYRNAAIDAAKEPK
jgi:hypothetical protein